MSEAQRLRVSWGFILYILCILYIINSMLSVFFPLVQWVNYRVLELIILIYHGCTVVVCRSKLHSC